MTVDAVDAMDIDMDKCRAELQRRMARIKEGREARRAAGVYAALPSVPELFRQRDVLITGASGFLGRVLVEKLLRSCPDVGTVYLLLRPKRGVPAADRVHGVVDAPLFDQLRREQPAALSKLVAVAGDFSELGLGLGAEDRALLQDRVSVVFHGAASVRFDDPVEKAVLLNTRGCRELVELCRGMHRLEALVHISTSYTNINQSPIGERLYPTDIDWRQAIKAASDPSIAGALDTLGHKLLGFHPNTYTFSKALAEQVMGEAAAHLPVIIVRPAIVVGAEDEPLRGWLDNVNSPAALWMAVNKGVIRVSPLCKTHYLMDWVPVDLIAKGTILAAWAKATGQDSQLQLAEDVVPAAVPAAVPTVHADVPVVNMAVTDVHPVTIKKMKTVYQTHVRRAAPYDNGLRYPFILFTRFHLQYVLCNFFFHIVFGIAVDLALRLANQKPRLLKIYRKLEVICNALVPIVERSYVINTSKFWHLQLIMHPDDEAAFSHGIEKYNHEKDCTNQLVGILEYALKEKFDREKGLRHIDRLFWLEMAFYAVLVVIFMYFLKPFSYLW